MNMNRIKRCKRCGNLFVGDDLEVYCDHCVDKLKETLHLDLIDELSDLIKYHNARCRGGVCEL